MEKNLWCYVDTGFLADFIERERAKYNNPNGKGYGEKKYVEEMFGISHATYLTIRKTGIVSPVAMKRMLDTNQLLKQTLIEMGVVKEIVLDLF